MKLVWLYVRSRRTGHALAALGIVAVLGWWWADAMLYLPMLRGRDMFYTPVLFFIPALSAAVVGAAAHSPFGDIERVVSWPVAPVRGGHLFALLVVALLTLLWAAQDWTDPGAPLLLARNVAGFGGLTLIGATMIGSRMSWIVPVAFGFVTHQLGRGERAQLVWWAWPLQPAGHTAALLGALGLLVVGLAVIARWGAHDQQGEAA